MIYQNFIDINYATETVVSKANYLLDNTKFALCVLTAVSLTILGQIYLLTRLYINHNNWQLPVTEYMVTSVALHKRSVAEAHLFGLKKRAGSSLENAVKSDLPLTITAIIANPHNSKLGTVILKDDNGKEKLYSIGENISRNARLEHVYQDKIYLDNNGVLEYINYPKLDINTEFNFERDLNFQRGNNSKVQLNNLPQAGQSDEIITDSGMEAVVEPFMELDPSIEQKLDKLNSNTNLELESKKNMLYKHLKKFNDLNPE
jgi:type II secretory pathway component PulC